MILCGFLNITDFHTEHVIYSQKKRLFFNQAVHRGKEQGANYLNFILGIPEAWFVISDINITWKTC